MSVGARETKIAREQHDSMLQGGPGDQAGPSADPRDTGGAGSQQGRPQQQEDVPAERDDGTRSPSAGSQVHGPGDDRAVSDMERRAGTPDDRATTDWAHGEGEPPVTGPPTDPARR